MKDDEFETFWRKYPRKVGKLAALAKYKKARQIATAEEILAGVDRYMLLKPDYADWCHATTFLSQGRWLDEPDSKPARQPTPTDDRPKAVDPVHQKYAHHDWNKRD